VGVLSVILLLIGPLQSPAYADEILFKGQGAHVGTVIEENEGTVTIRFPRESIQSIIRSPQGAPYVSKSNEPLQEKIDQLQQRIERLERNQGEALKPGSSPNPVPLRNATIQEQLFQEEMGEVEGVILWQGKPLANASVRIDLVTYTGSSLASVKKMFSGGEKGSPVQGISLSTQTDSHGRYTFARVPPGSYRLYWMPDDKTGWVHRLRENPDLEVFSGERTVQNIPEKLSTGRVPKTKQ